uniref:Uncharacterized protein n=1 Tax=Anguilla anguilla TaxID=7936 RepID=A0A0E9XX29_ANGAN
MGSWYLHKNLLMTGAIWTACEKENRLSLDPVLGLALQDCTILPRNIIKLNYRQAAQTHLSVILVLFTLVLTMGGSHAGQVIFLKLCSYIAVPATNIQSYSN